MKAAHVAGGAFGALAGLVVATVLRRYVGWDVTQADASLIGSAALSAGAGVGHVWTTTGLIPAVRRGIFGPPKAKDVAQFVETVKATGTAAPAPAPAPVEAPTA